MRQKVRLVGISLLCRGSFTIEISWTVLCLLYSGYIHCRSSGVQYPDFFLSCSSWEVSCSLRVQTCPTAKSSCPYYRITVSGFHPLPLGPVLAYHCIFDLSAPRKRLKYGLKQPPLNPGCIPAPTRLATISASFFT